MSAKHTPGPWFCGRALRGGQECIIGDGDSVVAFMPDRTIGCTFIPEDARLIAAAPKLLARLAAICEMQQANYGDGMSTHIALIGLCSEARAAIAEATGEQP